MTKGKVVFEVANVGSKSEGTHPFLIMEDGKKVKLGLLGDNPFMHTKLKPYNQKDVVVEGEFNDNGKFVATSIQVFNPEQEETKETVTDTVEEVTEEKPHIKSMPFSEKETEEKDETGEIEVEPCSCEVQTSEEVLNEEVSEEKPCCEEATCEETACRCETETCEE